MAGLVHKWAQRRLAHSRLKITELPDWDSALKDEGHHVARAVMTGAARHTMA
jgi:hypothetical protein